MSRQFNFMPSRYAVDASRHVTPRHTDVSRSERDAGVTSGGQIEDNRGTSTGVPRDTPGTEAGQLPPQISHRPVTVAERMAAAERRHAAFSLDFDHKRLVEGLGQLRIMGRHTAEALDAVLLAQIFKETGIPVDQLRAAYAAGQRDRANGVRCLCIRCQGRASREAERERWGTNREKGEPNRER